MLARLDETVREEVIEYLGPEEVAAAVVELESDDAVEVIQELDREEQQEVLDAVPPEARAILEEGLTYPGEKRRPDDATGDGGRAFLLDGRRDDRLHARDRLPCRMISMTFLSSTPLISRLARSRSVVSLEPDAR